jgi:hypothetical protein
MAYEYHGTTDLIALPNTTQRIVDGNIVVIEKDYAIRRDRLPDALENLAPGNKMPKTNYIIDTPADIQLGDDGFARIRLSGLDVDLAAESFDIQQKTTGFRYNAVPGIPGSASFTVSTGTFFYRRTIFSESQDPNFPDPVIPNLIQADAGAQVTFGESKWIGLTVAKRNIYENRVFEYNVTAICAPSNVTIIGPGSTVRWSLEVLPVNFLGIGMPWKYALTSVSGPAVSEANKIAELEADLRLAENAFNDAYRVQGFGGGRSINLALLWRKRIEAIQAQLRFLNK